MGTHAPQGGVASKKSAVAVGTRRAGRVKFERRDSLTAARHDMSTFAARWNCTRDGRQEPDRSLIGFTPTESIRLQPGRRLCGMRVAVGRQTVNVVDESSAES